jgi:hypothetical protein
MAEDLWWYRSGIGPTLSSRQKMVATSWQVGLIPLAQACYDFWVLKLDGSGNIQWQKTYGGTNWDWASSIRQTSDGGYIVAGYTDSFGSGNGDLWVLKLDSSGNINGRRPITTGSRIGPIPSSRPQMVATSWQVRLIPQAHMVISGS